MGTEKTELQKGANHAWSSESGPLLRHSSGRERIAYGSVVSGSLTVRLDVGVTSKCPGSVIAHGIRDGRYELADRGPWGKARVIIIVTNVASPPRIMAYLPHHTEKTVYLGDAKGSHLVLLVAIAVQCSAAQCRTETAAQQMTRL